MDAILKKYAKLAIEFDRLYKDGYQLCAIEACPTVHLTYDRFVSSFPVSQTRLNYIDGRNLLYTTIDGVKFIALTPAQEANHDEAGED